MTVLTIRMKKRRKINWAIIRFSIFFITFLIMLPLSYVFFFNVENKLSAFKVAAFSIMLIGGIFNYLAVYYNDWKMPVYIGGLDRIKTQVAVSSLKTSKKHFAFTNWKRIKFYSLCDIYKINIFNRCISYSVGDVLLFLGYILLMIFLTMGA